MPPIQIATSSLIKPTHLIFVASEDCKFCAAAVSIVDFGVESKEDQVS